jgi:hypothetical protein
MISSEQKPKHGSAGSLDRRALPQASIARRSKSRVDTPFVAEDLAAGREAAQHFMRAECRRILARLC